MLPYLIYFFLFSWIVYSFRSVRKTRKMVAQGADMKKLQISFIKQTFISVGILAILCLSVLFLFELRKQKEGYKGEIPRVGTLKNDTIVKAIWLQFACDCPRWVAYETYQDQSYLEDNCESLGHCFEIEASNKAEVIPETLYSALPAPVLELSGRFYKEQQIFRGDDRFFYARLFQYDEYRIHD